MRIICPYCGERSVGEFVAMGPADLNRPEADALVGSFVQYVHERSNPRGMHRELMYHAYGCRAWIAVSRDTQTHEVFAAEALMSDFGEGKSK